LSAILGATKIESGVANLQISSRAHYPSPSPLSVDGVLFENPKETFTFPFLNHNQRFDLLREWDFETHIVEP